MFPSDGACARITPSATVDFPDPDSPTRPRTLARGDLETHLVDRRQRLRSAEEAALLEAKPLGEVLDLQDRPAAFDRARRSEGFQLWLDRPDRLEAVLHVERGDRVQQCLEVGMLGRTEDLLRGAALHHAPLVDHHHLVGHVRDDAEIVGDEEDAHAHLALHVAQELQDLGLDGDVERGRRLVGDEEGGMAHHRHRDHRALAQTPGELERVLVDCALGLGKLDEAQHVGRRLARLGAIHAAMEPARLADLIADGVERRQARHRLLEDHRNAVAADAPHPPALGRQRCEVDALAALGIVEHHRAASDPGDRGQEPHHRLADGRLARARLADDRDRLALRYRERDAVDGAHDALATILHHEIAHVENAHRHPSRSRGVREAGRSRRCEGDATFPIGRQTSTGGACVKG